MIFPTITHLGPRLENAIRERGIQKEGQIFVFSLRFPLMYDMFYLKLEETCSGMRTDEKSIKLIGRGVKNIYYDGDVNGVVDELLAEPNTIGFAAPYEDVFRYLEEAGTFEWEVDKPIRYKRGNRVYQVF